ncbi:hypothetical protein BH24PSE1_BH24PSE1_12870 [soil metagenome]
MLLRHDPSAALNGERCGKNQQGRNEGRECVFPASSGLPVDGRRLGMGHELLPRGHLGDDRRPNVSNHGSMVTSYDE